MTQLLTLCERVRCAELLWKNLCSELTSCPCQSRHHLTPLRLWFSLCKCLLGQTLPWQAWQLFKLFPNLMFVDFLFPEKSLLFNIQVTSCYLSSWQVGSQYEVKAKQNKNLLTRLHRKWKKRKSLHLRTFQQGETITLSHLGSLS